MGSICERRMQVARRVFVSVAAIVLLCSGLAQASATLLLEEPYGTLGFFTATGHAAVYLSDVCAETPLVLRRCAPGETGVVLSRYAGVGGYDWIAVPLLPYLYAVDRAEDVPLFSDPKMTAFLRDRYRRKYLEDVAPDTKDGGMPGGNWYELVGSSYDRTIYGFEIETTPERDDALIQKLNSSRNVSHFRLVRRNCADFAKDVLNFYYPKTLHRSIIADAGITTPKQMAKLLVKYSARHPQIQFSRIVIPQVPGGMPRSTAVHGVVESFFKAKKYIVPSAVVSPIFAGCVAAVYVVTGAGHFEPARGAMVFVVGGNPERPLDREDLRAYREQLTHLLAGTYPEKSAQSVDKSWERLQARSQKSVDAEGRPVLQMELGNRLVQVGASADNVFAGKAPPQLVRQLLEARLHSELYHRPSHGVTESEVSRDWKLLQQSISGGDSHLDARLNQHSETTRGDQP
jgi:hypothetical protein